MFRVGIIYFSTIDGARQVYSVCSVLVASQDKPGCDPEVRNQWPIDGSGAPIAGVTALAVLNDQAATIAYAAKP